MRRWKILRLNSWTSSIFFGKNCSENLALVAAIGIGCSTGTNLSGLSSRHPKADQQRYVPDADFGKGNIQPENCCRIEIGCAFFVSFFAQAKKENA